MEIVVTVHIFNVALNLFIVVRNPFYLDTESGSNWTPKRENSHLPFSGSLVSSSGQFGVQFSHGFSFQNQFV
jgi:hypothetical protein